MYNFVIRKFPLIFFIFLFSDIYSQREANIWYFGKYAGIDFNSGKPEPLNNSAMNTWEGCSSISDTLGNLLFYTNGIKIWNRKHSVMTNGSNLNGDTSSTQSAVIVRQPGTEPIYFVFTVDYQAHPNGFEYSVVDMRLDNGFGDVVAEKKNIVLLTPTCEKIACVNHQNNKDSWIISHGWNDSVFYSYLLTENGLQLPVISKTGSVYSPDEYNLNLNAIGYLRASCDGKKIASAVLYNSTVEIFDFDNSTGILSNPIKITFPQIFGTYGVEFSPDVSKLYVTSSLELYQVNLLAGTSNDIINSVFLIHHFDSYPSALQLGPDGRIYLTQASQTSKKYLSIINHPDSLGLLCDFKYDTLFLEIGITQRGLPNFNPSFLIPPVFRFSNNCDGDSVRFQIVKQISTDSVLWNFGEPSSQQNNFSKLISPNHLYSKPGIYTVILFLWKNGSKTISRQNIQVTPLPEINLGSDTAICSGKILTLSISNHNLSVLWNNLSTDYTLNVSQAGTYSVKVQNKYTDCINFDTIKVEYLPRPQIDLGKDTGFCENSNFKLDAFHKKYSYLWNTTEITPEITVSSPGNYWVSVTDSFSCQNSDTIHLSAYPIPKFSLGNDTVICYGTSLFLQSYLSDVQSLWQNGSHSDNFIAAESGIYWLQLTDSIGCQFRDSIILKYKGLPKFDLGKDTVLCENTPLILSPDTIFSENTIFLWNDNYDENTLSVSNSGLYKLTATDKCGSFSDSVRVEFKYCGPVEIPNVFTPNGDGINEVFYIKGIDEGRWILYVYSRWGDLIYRSDNYKNDWSPQNIMPGVYYYLLFEYSGTRKFKGFVHVLK
jgi:gliding motility-associated-like protein